MKELVALAVLLFTSLSFAVEIGKCSEIKVFSMIPNLVKEPQIVPRDDKFMDKDIIIDLFPLITVVFDVTGRYIENVMILQYKEKLHGSRYKLEDLSFSPFHFAPPPYMTHPVKQPVENPQLVDRYKLIYLYLVVPEKITIRAEIVDTATGKRHRCTFYLHNIDPGFYGENAKELISFTEP